MKGLDAALYSHLTTGATSLYALVGIRAYLLLAPPDAEYPFVVYQHQAGGDVNMEPVDRLDLLYMVKGFGRTVGEVQAVADAIRARLHGASLTVSGWTCLKVEREQAIMLSEVVNGVPIWQIGALYRIRLAAA